MATVVDALGSRFGDEVDHEILRDPELTRLLSRRTCREYGPAPVSSDLERDEFTFVRTRRE